jgi:hypothetical protein
VGFGASPIVSPKDEIPAGRRDSVDDLVSISILLNGAKLMGTFFVWCKY